LFGILSSKSVLAQAPKKIIVEHSDFADVNGDADAFTTETCELIMMVLS
jgi:hypothetical protein